jgi:hypothetical protein
MCCFLPNEPPLVVTNVTVLFVFQYKIDDADFRTLTITESAEEQRQILENVSRHLPNTNINVQGFPRFCDKCKVIKPDRTHHCSVCGECVLKMDHHCPWINNCVSFTNYKFFLLFLGYALFYCIYVSLTSLPYFIDFWRVSADRTTIVPPRLNVHF